ncbi:MAG TPA: twin-arginine translocation signal domain-containing protein, partial [Burkholderiaceae bacterium]|nr:twin-arginine translocation signal domain-containing protein [Burkholderiaceae bacterium]
MKNDQPSRRGFFKAVAIGGATAAAAVATTLVGERKIISDTAVADDSKQLGYREPAHLRHDSRTTQVETGDSPMLTKKSAGAATAQGRLARAVSGMHGRT